MSNPKFRWTPVTHTQAAALASIERREDGTSIVELAQPWSLPINVPQLFQAVTQKQLPHHVMGCYTEEDCRSTDENEAGILPLDPAPQTSNSTASPESFQTLAYRQRGPLFSPVMGCYTEEDCRSTDENEAGIVAPITPEPSSSSATASLESAQQVFLRRWGQLPSHVMGCYTEEDCRSTDENEAGNPIAPDPVPTSPGSAQPMALRALAQARQQLQSFGAQLAEWWQGAFRYELQLCPVVAH